MEEPLPLSVKSCRPTLWQKLFVCVIISISMYYNKTNLESVKKMYKLGLDIGSTTIKCVVLDEEDKVVCSSYDRHLSQVASMTEQLLRTIADKVGARDMEVTISGSAGMGLANNLQLPFVQEVYSTRTAVNRLMPGTDVVIELGGEDAKILFLTNGFEARMNGSCAGGTGAFIDQMATLIHVSPDELNALSAKHDKLYTIASRCGVFAKSDIQPLLNQGASVPNIAASIFKAVVNQTIGGLAQGREIAGNVLYLGGPLTFFSELQKSFNETLDVNGVCPEHSLYYVAIGAAVSGDGESRDILELADRIRDYSAEGAYLSCEPLFVSEQEYQEFCDRHEGNSSGISYLSAADGPMYLGIDAGSTTVKAVICNENGDILNQMYQPNHGNPVPIIRNWLMDIYETYPDIVFANAAVTGYGEDIIKHAFGVDVGIVETIAHYTAARKFKEDVDFIIDIGGQDIKCFKIHNNAIDNIFLNEACSSGCGSFLQTFAEALNYDIRDFAKLGLYADKPVELGSRCTVFMNSSVKQAQKDGASIENISAGLSMSVVKNALYKVIRCGSAKDLGEHIVVQGGTFLNDAVLRAFEQEIGHEVVRPSIAGIMGAYGAALYAKEKGCEGRTSSLLSREQIMDFKHDVRVTTCRGCDNHCQLTVNSFGGRRTFIAGNRCEKPLNVHTGQTKYNLYEYKMELLNRYRRNERDSGKITIGIPMVLNMYELLPFWHTMLCGLGFNVIVSPASTRELYVSGQHTIPSDTVCFPAKLVHGHIEALLDKSPDAIFYPCMSYNLDEKKGDNHYNCPVVAYYPEVVRANINAVEQVEFIHDFVGIHNRREFPKRLAKILNQHLKCHITVREAKKAADLAYKEYEQYMAQVRMQADRFLAAAREEKRPVIVIAGRPYHMDPEVNHGLDNLICELGAVVITEDGISNTVDKFRTTVLNQWTYHSRLYLAAKYVAEADAADNINLVQFVSFGCGVDAITTDETRSILEDAGKIYTQLKIDEVTNMGAAKIRIRSLFAAAGAEN